MNRFLTLIIVGCMPFLSGMNPAELAFENFLKQSNAVEVLLDEKGSDGALEQIFAWTELMMAKDVSFGLSFHDFVTSSCEDDSGQNTLFGKFAASLHVGAPKVIWALVQATADPERSVAGETAYNIAKKADNKIVIDLFHAVILNKRLEGWQRDPRCSKKVYDFFADYPEAVIPFSALTVDGKKFASLLEENKAGHVQDYIGLYENEVAQIWNLSGALSDFLKLHPLVGLIIDSCQGQDAEKSLQRLNECIGSPDLDLNLLPGHFEGCMGKSFDQFLKERLDDPETKERTESLCRVFRNIYEARANVRRLSYFWEKYPSNGKTDLTNLITSCEEDPDLRGQEFEHYLVSAAQAGVLSEQDYDRILLVNGRALSTLKSDFSHVAKLVRKHQKETIPAMLLKCALELPPQDGAFQGCATQFLQYVEKQKLNIDKIPFNDATIGSYIDDTSHQEDSVIFLRSRLRKSRSVFTNTDPSGTSTTSTPPIPPAMPQKASASSPAVQKATSSLPKENGAKMSILAHIQGGMDDDKDAASRFKLKKVVQKTDVDDGGTMFHVASSGYSKLAKHFSKLGLSIENFVNIGTPDYEEYKAVKKRMAAIDDESFGDDDESEKEQKRQIADDYLDVLKDRAVSHFYQGDDFWYYQAMQSGRGTGLMTNHAVYGPCFARLANDSSIESLGLKSPVTYLLSFQQKAEYTTGLAAVANAAALEEQTKNETGITYAHTRKLAEEKVRTASIQELTKLSTDLGIEYLDRNKVVGLHAGLTSNLQDNEDLKKKIIDKRTFHVIYATSKTQVLLSIIKDSKGDLSIFLVNSLNTPLADGDDTVVLLRYIDDILASAYPDGVPLKVDLGKESQAGRTRGMNNTSSLRGGAAVPSLFDSLKTTLDARRRAHTGEGASKPGTTLGKVVTPSAPASKHTPSSSSSATKQVGQPMPSAVAITVGGEASSSVSAEPPVVTPTRSAGLNGVSPQGSGKASQSSSSMPTAAQSGQIGPKSVRSGGQVQAPATLGASAGPLSGGGRVQAMVSSLQGSSIQPPDASPTPPVMQPGTVSTGLASTLQGQVFQTGGIPSSPTGQPITGPVDGGSVSSVPTTPAAANAVSAVQASTNQQNVSNQQHGVGQATGLGKPGRITANRMFIVALVGLGAWACKKCWDRGYMNQHEKGPAHPRAYEVETF